MNRQLWRASAIVVLIGGAAMIAHAPATILAAATGHELESTAAQISFDEVVRQLSRSGSGRARGRDAGPGRRRLPRSYWPLSVLVIDPVDDIQIEAIDTLLDFFIVERVIAKKRVALVLEVREKSKAKTVFDMGPFVLLPRSVPPELVANLSRAIADEHPRVRREAVYGLGTMARPPVDRIASDALALLLADKDDDLRFAAARVAGALRSTATGNALITAINDKDKDVKIAAMRALGDVKDPQGVQALTEQFNYYGTNDLGLAAMDGLARLGNPASASFFRAQITAKSPLVRRYAVEGLARAGELADPTAVEMIAVKETEPDVRLAFAFALQAGGGRSQMDRLVSALNDSKLEAQAMGYLVELGRPHVPALAISIQDPEPRVRERVVMALGLIGGPDAASALERATRDPNLDVARAAERGLARARAM